MANPDNELRGVIPNPTNDPTADDKDSFNHVVHGMLALINGLDNETRLKLARAFITEVVIKDQDLIDGWLGIEILERQEDRAEGEDCFGYIFGPNANAEEITNAMTTTFTQLQDPVPGCYVLYMDPGDSPEYVKPKHVGIAVSKIRVVSKWGWKGHVFEHRFHYSLMFTEIRFYLLFQVALTSRDHLRLFFCVL